MFYSFFSYSTSRPAKTVNSEPLGTHAGSSSKSRGGTCHNSLSAVISTMARILYKFDNSFNECAFKISLLTLGLVPLETLKTRLKGFSPKCEQRLKKLFKNYARDFLGLR